LVQEAFMTVPASFLTEGLAHHQRGELVQAEEMYQRVLAADPTNAEVLHLIGVVCLQGGQPGRAVESIERAVAHAPNDPDLHANLGEAYRALGEGGRAGACFRHALALQAEHANAAYNLGTLLMQQGRVAEAVTRFRQAVRSCPSFALAHNNLRQPLYRHAVARWRSDAATLQPLFDLLECADLGKPSDQPPHARLVCVDGARGRKPQEPSDLSP
jgi:Tfp pilus assembly protein PilF